MSDPTTDFRPEMLLRHVDWLRRLVGALGVDATEADDLAQQTLHDALARPPATVRHPRAWLAAIARHILRRSGQRAARRQESEQRFAPAEALPATDDVVAQTARLREVVDAVLELDEPYRTAVLLRFFEELPPRAIAARTQAPVETVRTRLKRGLEQLRQKLVRGRAAAPRAPSLWLGGTIVSTQTKLVAAAVVIFAGGIGVSLLVRGLAVAPSSAAAPIAATSRAASESGAPPSDRSGPVAATREVQPREAPPADATEPAAAPTDASASGLTQRFHSIAETFKAGAPAVLDAVDLVKALAATVQPAKMNGSGEQFDGELSFPGETLVGHLFVRGPSRTVSLYDPATEGSGSWREELTVHFNMDAIEDPFRNPTAKATPGPSTCTVSIVARPYGPPVKTEAEAGRLRSEYDGRNAGSNVSWGKDDAVSASTTTYEVVELADHGWGIATKVTGDSRRATGLVIDRSLFQLWNDRIIASAPAASAQKR